MNISVINTIYQFKLMRKKVHIDLDFIFSSLVSIIYIIMYIRLCFGNSVGRIKKKSDVSSVFLDFRGNVFAMKKMLMFKDPLDLWLRPMESPKQSLTNVACM